MYSIYSHLIGDSIPRLDPLYYLKELIKTKFKRISELSFVRLCCSIFNEHLTPPFYGRSIIIPNSSPVVNTFFEVFYCFLTQRSHRSGQKQKVVPFPNYFCHYLYNYVTLFLLRNDGDVIVRYLDAVRYQRFPDSCVDIVRHDFRRKTLSIVYSYGQNQSAVCKRHKVYR